MLGAWDTKMKEATSVSKIGGQMMTTRGTVRPDSREGAKVSAGRSGKTTRHKC